MNDTLIPMADPLGLPVPPAILLFLKVLGYFLHMVFMNLWLVGLPLAVVIAKKREKTAARLFHVMPFAMAFGINAGVVPLLFLQTLYPGFFYSATILQAWAWLFVIPCVLVAYYSVYLASFGIYRKVAALAASFFLTWVGITFASSLRFMEHPASWGTAFHNMADSGSVYGLYFHMSPDLLLRLGMVIGMALGTVAVFIALDAFVFGHNNEYRQESRRLIPLLYLLGVAVYGVCGLVYAPGLQGRAALPQSMFWATAISMPMAAIVVMLFAASTHKWLAMLAAAGHLAVLALNAVSRQLVQSARLGEYGSLGEMSVRGEWASFVLFIVVLAAALATVGWLVHTIATAPAKAEGVTR